MRSAWPALPYDSWKETCATVHRWVQIVGKVRLQLAPWLNHAWHATFYVTERGLGSSLIPGPQFGFSLNFDFIDHCLDIERSDGVARSLALRSESVAEFHERFCHALTELGIDVSFCGTPNELPDATPFSKDHTHCAYDAEAVHTFWRILLSSERVMQKFRAGFVGKVSPVHFFWGSFDLAVTRFSGRRAPEHPGGVPHLPDLVTRDAYSHEVSSCGFWPGHEQFPAPAFYNYAYPKPLNLESTILPDGAYYHSQLREFILPYAIVRTAADPEALILEFFQRTYAATAILGDWDRAALEETPYLIALQKRRAA